MKRRTPTPLRHNLCSSVVDGVAASVMVGIGETYLPAFALATGMSEVGAGLVASMPMLAGAIIQLGSPLMVQRLGSNRSWVVGCAVAQAACFLPLAAAALYGAIPPWAVFVLAACYWASSMGGGPAWNTWLSTLVPPRIRPRYFSRRSRVTQAAVLTGLLSGGLILHGAEGGGWRLGGFALIFGIAFGARMISAYFLRRQGEPVPPPRTHRAVPLSELLRRFRTGNDGKLFIYMVTLQLGVQISGPYFTPFMIGQLELSYGAYMLLISISFSAKVLSLPLWGRVAQRLGAKQLMMIGGLGIVPLSLLWAVSNDYYYLLAIQIFSGSVWAAYELGTFLMLFETISDEERTSILTTFNVANAGAMVTGAFIGGSMIAALGADKSAYFAVFAFSSAIRGGSLLLLRRIHDVEIIVPTPVATRTDAVRPSAGSIERPLIVGMSKTRLGKKKP